MKFLQGQKHKLNFVIAYFYSNEDAKFYCYIKKFFSFFFWGGGGGGGEWVKYLSHFEKTIRDL